MKTLSTILNGISGMTTGSLFSSGGGWEIGAVRAGMRPIWGVEYEKDRCDLWNRTFPTGRCINADVGDVAENLKLLTPVDILFTSPVCRDYSAAQTRVAQVNACRPKLGLFTLDYVAALRPKVVMLENVTGYKKDEEFRVYAQIVEGMLGLGYDHKEAILDAAYFGNPSYRKRLFAVFVLKGSGFKFKFPAAPLMTKLKTWDDTTRPLWPSMPQSPPADSQTRSLADLQSIGEMPEYPILFVSQSMQTINDRNNYVVPHGRPAPTLTQAKGLSSWRIGLSPTDTRKLTAEAALRLNGFLVPGKFPSEYGRNSSTTLVFNIVGDAVSPIMAEALLSGLTR